MNQPVHVLIKRIVLSLLILLTLTGCKLVSLINPTEFTPTPTETPASENCFWTWAYGSGSTEFDKTVSEQLTAKGVSATINSSSYGEVNSCGNTYSAMALDVKVEIKVDNLADQELLARISDIVFTALKENLAISQVNNLGNVNLSFITPEGYVCYWSQSQQLCAE